MSVQWNFPDALVGYLRLRFGHILNVESLSGVAGSGATRLKFDAKSVVVKCSKNPSERLIYERYSDRLKHAGVNMADILWLGQDDEGLNWIVMEEILRDFPRDQWTDNPEQLRNLFCLHSSTPTSALPELEDFFFHPTWDSRMTELTCSWYRDTSHCNEISSLLNRAQEASQVLFTPQCCLSGDPNPTNWRIRDDGSLVLVDWERFCYGHPAIDLAIAIPGLGSEDSSLEKSMARRYIEIWRGFSDKTPPSETELVFEIQIGKLWSAVEFMANATVRPSAYPKATVESIVRELPNVLHRLSL